MLGKYIKCCYADSLQMGRLRDWAVCAKLPFPHSGSGLKALPCGLPNNSQRKHMSLKAQPNKKTLPSSKTEPSNDMLYLQNFWLCSHSISAGGNLCFCHADQHSAPSWAILKSPLTSNGLNPRPMYRHDLDIRSGARPWPRLKPAGPQT